MKFVFLKLLHVSTQAGHYYNYKNCTKESQFFYRHCTKEGLQEVGCGSVDWIDLAEHK